MKKIVLFITILCSLQAVSQNVNRIEVLGKIIVEGSDISGITVINKTSKVGTITNDEGEFTMQVALNDVVEVSALQYQNISFEVNEAILKSKRMKLFLIEEINKLDEVVVTEAGLTGNLAVDLESAAPFNPKLDALYFGVKNNMDHEFKPDNKTKVENLGQNYQQQRMINGLNIVNVVDQLLLPLFRSNVSDKKKAGVPEVPIESIKPYFGAQFLKDNFNIPEHRTQEFIQFVEKDNFDFTLLNYGKEMEFLELLNQKSIEFLNQKK
ncbi:carboxypeptidase-like regulatory domain-containing protein [Tamlana sp. s12]|uniref:carboxypeptidase-like regulatory domain-containing protein n=1 Tax=Tamlana sp. s12 TaxID=1630406 RepID=UPI0007FBC058|nr:carboxypeptidase-like regulatory domain-containing protein [Tamlana sp. s12]OBQ56158.1 membrane protein [Tamlana sp. s12]QQY83676.1 carboxypeptidase-like regulatory domain-containing protein [Tamlana sp. s12]